MKIIGLHGLDDPQSIRAEVERGGRFVIYLYCVSVVVITFKRGSDIHFIRPGQSAVARGLPCTFISLLLGWWGFPWGLVYTIEALVKNLGGGTDVTDAVLAQLDPLPFGAATAEAASRPAAAVSTPPPMPLRTGVPPPPAPSAALGAFRLALLIIALGATGWIGIALYRGANVPAALVNGLPTPVSIVLDNEAPRTLAPNTSEHITLSEGAHSFTWTRPDGRTESESFELRTPFWSRPLHREVAVVNPDRSALVYRETTRYYPDGETPAEGKNDYELHAGRAFYLFPAADYFFEEFPQRLSLKSRQPETKTRHSHADKLDLSQRLFALDAEKNDADARALMFRVGELYPENEFFLGLTLQRLRVEDTDAFFAPHLDDRPLRLEWHRAYQHHVEYRQPARDLLPRYRQLAAELPEDGTAAYLAARIETDPSARRSYLRRAVEAARPCPYAHNSLAYEALTNARFAEALAHLRSAESAGLASLSFRSTQNDILLANGLVDEALRHLRALRAEDPRPFAPTTRPYLGLELLITCHRSPRDTALENSLVQPYLASIKPLTTPEQQVEAAAEFAALAAYARGDEVTYAARLANASEARFAVAITRGRAAEAARALEELPRVPGTSWLLVYLAGREAGDTAAADSAFDKALAAFASESREHRSIAALLRAGDADPAKICPELLPLGDKCVLAAALGHRFPAHRAAYHELAAKLNFKPDFPALFIARQLRPAPAAPSAPSML